MTKQQSQPSFFSSLNHLTIVSIVFAICSSAVAANNPVRDQLAIPEGNYQFVKGDSLCDSSRVRLQYREVENDLTLTIGEKIIFAYINRPSFSEDAGDGAKEVCTATTLTQIKSRDLESKVAQVCKNKSHSFEQSQVLTYANDKLTYKFARTQLGDAKPFSASCEYKTDSGSKR